MTHDPDDVPEDLTPEELEAIAAANATGKGSQEADRVPAWKAELDRAKKATGHDGGDDMVRIRRSLAARFRAEREGGDKETER